MRKEISYVSEKNKTFLALEISVKELMKIEREVKCSILLADDEKNKTLYYLNNVISYLMKIDGRKEKPKGVVGSNNETAFERLTIYKKWRNDIEYIYSKINWNVSLCYLNLDIKILKKLFNQLKIHMNAKIKYLEKECKNILEQKVFTIYILKRRIEIDSQNDKVITKIKTLIQRHQNKL